jgi:hypothetical protein
LINIYEIALILGLVLSILLLFYSIFRNGYLGLLDYFVILSYFWVFYRPAFIDECISYINQYLYFWNESSYQQGVYLTVSFLILLQLGGAFPSPKKHKLRLRSSGLKDFNFNEISKLNDIFIRLFIFIFALCLLFYGVKLLPTHKVGAYSNTLPGFEYIFQIQSILGTLGISISIFLLMEKGNYKYIFYLLLFFSFFLLIGRRGRIVLPVILGLCFFFSYISWKYSFTTIFKKIDIKLLLMAVLILFVVFQGKNFVYKKISSEYVTKSSFGNDKICLAIKNGHQEYDLLWPAVIELLNEKYQVLDFPEALIGGAIPHKMRLDSGEFYSLTDKLMMKYNKEQYYELKFGISPNIFQFYYAYFSILSFLIIFIVGFLSRKMEFKMLGYFFKGRVFMAMFMYILIYLIQSPFDFFLKYFVIQIIVLVIIYCIVNLYRGRSNENITSNN